MPAVMVMHGDQLPAEASVAPSDQERVEHQLAADQEAQVEPALADAQQRPWRSACIR